MRPTQKRSIPRLFAMAGIAAVASSAYAQDPTPSIDALKRQIDQQQREIDALKERIQAPMPASPTAATAQAPASGDAKSSDRLSLSDTPEGYRLIDTGTTSLGLYGLIDLTIASSSSGGPNANPRTDTGGGSNSSYGVTNKRWTGLDVSWMNGNRWGFNGSHVLDAETGTKLIMRLESEFELPTGNFDGGFSAPIIFNRDAWIGFASPTIGKLTFGRQDSPGRDINMIWANPFSTARNGYDEGGWMNNQTMYQLMEYSGSPTGNRWDSAMVWKKDWGGVVSYAGVQFAGLQDTSPASGGTDVVDTGHGLHTTQQTVGLGYNSDDDLWHANAAGTFANYDGYRKSVYSAGGNVRPAKWLRLNGGFIRADIAQPAAVGKRTDDTWTLSAQIYPGGKFDYALAYYSVDAHNAGLSSGGTTLQPFDLTNGVTAAASGHWNTVYGAAFYRFDRQTDFYLAFDYSKTDGGYVAPYFQGHPSFNQVGAGVRYFF